MKQFLGMVTEILPLPSAGVFINSGLGIYCMAKNTRMSKPFLILRQIQNFHYKFADIGFVFGPKTATMVED